MKQLKVLPRNQNDHSSSGRRCKVSKKRRKQMRMRTTTWKRKMSSSSSGFAGQIVCGVESLPMSGWG